MPATEKTWRNQARLHVIFGISSIAMLVTTLWMLRADHTREWKEHQREFRNMETTMIRWLMLAEKTGAEISEQQELKSALRQAQAEPPSSELLAQFRQAVNEYRKVEQEVSEYDFSDIDQLYDELKAAAWGADMVAAASLNERKFQDEARQWRTRLLSKLQAIITAAKFREDFELGRRKFKATLPRLSPIANWPCVINLAKTNSPRSKQPSKTKSKNSTRSLTSTTSGAPTAKSCSATTTK